MLPTFIGISFFIMAWAVGLYRLREQPSLGDEVADTSTLVLNVLRVVGEMLLAFPTGVLLLLYVIFVEPFRYIFDRVSGYDRINNAPDNDEQEREREVVEEGRSGSDDDA